MGQDWLHGLAIVNGLAQLSIERQTSELLNFDYVIEKFATLKAQKINFETHKPQINHRISLKVYMLFFKLTVEEGALQVMFAPGHH